MAKGGAGGVEVGRVSIRVVPNFDDFHRRMNEVYETYKKRPLKVEVEVDTDQLDDLTARLAKQAKIDAGKAGKAITKELSKVSKSVELTPTINNKLRYKRRMEASINKLFNDLEVRLNYKTGDDVEFRKHWDNQEKYIRKQLAKINGTMGDGDFTAQAAGLDRLFADLRRKSGNVWDSPEVRAAATRYGSEVKLATKELEKQKQNMADLAAMTERAAAANRKINRVSWYNKAETRAAFREYLYGFRDMGVAIDNLRRKSSGDFLINLEDPVKRVADRADRLRLRGGLIGALVGGTSALGALKLAKNGVEGIGKAAAGAAGQVTGMAGKFADLGKKLKPNFGTGINMGGYAVILAGVLALAAPAVGLLTTALLAIPGILATFIAPIGAIVLGFGGIRKAAEKAGLFADKNGDKKGGGSLGEALTELQKKTEDVFENTLTEPFKKFGDLSKELIAPMETVAQGAADIMAGMVNSINDNIENGRIGETM